MRSGADEKTDHPAIIFDSDALIEIDSGVFDSESF